MSVRIDVDCTRCGKRVGTAKISVPLSSLNYTLESIEEMSPVIVDQDDLKYWRGRHSREDCDALIDEKRAKWEASLRTHQGEMANAQG